MAKRFTDTEKWSHSWFRKLSPKMKCAWIYLCDKCDHAGIWTSDFEALSFHVGEDVSDVEIMESFGEKIQRVKYDKFIIQSFIDFQYGTLNPENRVHQSVLSKLEKEGAHKDLKRTLKGPKDKDKDKDKDNIAEIEKIYAEHYPLKKGKSEGIKKISKELKTDQDILDFKNAVIKYADECKAKGYESKYIKHFSTFTTSWRDWLDPDVGTSNVMPIRKSEAQKNFDIMQDQYDRIMRGEL